MNPNKGILRIGTSGIALRGSKETFPPEFQQSSRLHYYSTLFNTLEVNSTFKKIPMLSTLEKWSLDVADNFQFTIKVWKEITHAKQLDFSSEDVSRFVSVANHIGIPKGCLLIQFPASITYEYHKHVNKLLRCFQNADDQNLWRKAVEFRSPTWDNSPTYKMLNTLNASMVLQDMPKSKNLQPVGKDDFVYYRFHGPNGDYRDSYTNEFLQEQAENIRGLLKQGKDVYAYFNNTMGDAYENALYLKVLYFTRCKLVNYFYQRIGN